MPKGRLSKFLVALTASLAVVAVLALPRVSRTAVTSPREVTVLVMPFEINAGPDLAYLKQGLPDLLSDRLRDAGFTVVDKAAVEKSLASKGLKITDPQAGREAALQNNAGYVISGSFSQLGEVLSIDARINDPFGVKPPKPVFATRNGLMNLLPAVDELVTKMKSDLLGLDRIVDIDVEGVQALDKEVVLMRMTTKRGDTLDAKSINADLKTVYDLGYFDDVKMVLRDVSGGKSLVVQVVEKPRIQALGVKGNKALKADDILKAANSKKGAILNPKVLGEDISAIRELYRKDGYYNAKVTHEIENSGQGQARLNFVIEEGNKLYIKKISIEGAKQISESTLKDELSLKEHGMFSWLTSAGVLKEDQLERDNAAISAYYNNRGFMDAKVGNPELKFEEDGIVIVFKVQEGSRFRVEKVRVEGDLIADEAKLLALTKLKGLADAKDFLDRSKVRDDLKALTDYYNNFGYAYAEANVRLNDHPEDKSVDVIYEVRKLQRVHIRRVLVEGNTKTRDNVILREMRLADGDLFSGEKLKRSSDRLDKLGYFESVDIEPVPTGSPEEMDLKIKVKDKDTGRIGGGVGYSTYDGVYFAANVAEANMFGKGWSTNLSGQWGGKKTSYIFNALNPRWDDTNLGVGLQLYDKKENLVDYERSTLGGKVSFIYPVGEYTSFITDYRLDRYDIYDVASGAAKVIQDAKGKHTASVVSASLSRDTTNGSPTSIPTEGTVNTVGVAYGGGFIGGSDNFVKGSFENNWFYNLFGDMVLHTNGQVGVVGENWDSKVPLGERFYLGGMGSVRGYSTRKISPIDATTGEAVGGNKYLVGSLELLYPISKKMGVIVSGFFDAGNTWDEGEMFFSQPNRRVASPSMGLYKSVGMGIRWFSPMGPLRIEFGHGLDKVYESTSNKVEFGMGQTF